MVFIYKKKISDCYMIVIFQGCVFQKIIFMLFVYIYILVGPKDSVVLCDRRFEDLHFHNECERGGRRERRRKKEGGKKPHPTFWERKVSD